jgi:hypothetical protein
MRILSVVLCNYNVTMIYPLCCVIAVLPGYICHAVLLQCYSIATISVITISQLTFLARMEYDVPTVERALEVNYLCFLCRRFSSSELRFCQQVWRCKS